ncbi:MAG: hypothetical protein IIY62_08030 [Kiritimatiellae bacterium]|jgi:HPt (histidine-containing phosphotransfer) domain-containing protein|nr:hypothetical protein [Kiritimatiellia bacterium]
MSLGVSRTTEPLSFNTGIGNASFAEVMDTPAAGEMQKSLLPGSTTVTQALDALFPTDRAVRDEVMSALVAGNTAYLRTPGGFNETAHRALGALHASRTEAADAAAREIETLLADTDLFEHYRMSLLET